MLALSADAVAGSVFLPDQGMFQIQPVGGGFLRITKVSGVAIPACGSPKKKSRTSSTSSNILRSSGVPSIQASSSPVPPTNSIIDLLIVYTAAARVGAGGTEEMATLIDAAVAEVNVAFENSEVRAQLRLVHAAEVNYQESGSISDDLDELENDDSPLRIVHELRRTHRADLVSMITETTGGPFGLANQMHELDLEFGEVAFSIVQRQFVIAYQVLAHEIGHNMGCQHDRETSPTGGAFQYSHALRFEAEGTLYHTVMAYQPGVPIPYFSNPDVTFLGVATGISELFTNSANNARTLNRSAALVARFDSLHPPGTPPEIALVTPTNGAVFYVPAVLDLVAEASDADGQVVEVEFYVNGVPVGRRHAPPYSMQWTSGSPGTFFFQVEAYDDAGWRVKSPTATVTLRFAPPVLDATNLLRLSDGSFQLRILGADGQPFQLDASENLTDWSPLTTDSLFGGFHDFTDVDATNHPVRFYRVLPVP